MIFQFEYAQRGAVVSVDHFAGSDPEALEFCGTTVYPEMAWLMFMDLFPQGLEMVFIGSEVHFVNLDRT